MSRKMIGGLLAAVLATQAFTASAAWADSAPPSPLAASPPADARLDMLALAGPAMGPASMLAADGAGAASAELPPPTPHALALARRYMAAVRFSETMKRIMDPLMGRMMDVLSKDSSMPESYRTAMRESATEAMDAYLPRMVEEVTPLMAQIYSEDELQGLVDFYEGPVGQALIAKGPRFSAAMAGHIPALTNGVKVDMLTRFCGKIKCTAEMRQRLGLPDKGI